MIGELTEWFFPKELFGEEKLSYEEYMSFAKDRFENEKYEDALNYYNKALKIDKHSKLAAKRKDECIRKLIDLEYLAIQKDLQYLLDETQRQKPDIARMYNGLDMIKVMLERIQNKKFCLT